MEKQADALDRAATVTQEAVDRNVSVIRKEAAKIDTTNPGGQCLCCEREIGTDRRWCDFDCMTLWEKGGE